MTTPSITISGVTFTFNDGDVEEIDYNIISEVEQEAMPGMTPDAAMMYDFNGVKKIISLQGALTNTGNNTLSTGSATTINEQREWLEKSINGSQNAITFVSNYSTTFNGSSFVNSKCYKTNIRFNERSGEPNRLYFTITLLVGDV